MGRLAKTEAEQLVMAFVATNSIGLFAVAWVVFVVGGVWGLCRAWFLARHTTLQAAWYWLLVAFLGMAGVEVWALVRGPSSSGLAPWRYLATIALVCPGIAVLGAKRPQHFAWQFVVFSLGVIFALPAIEFLVLSRGAEFVIAATRGWFLVAAVVVGVANYVPTRFGLAALAGGASQAALLAAPLQLISPQYDVATRAVGLFLAAMAGFLLVWARPRAPSPLPEWTEFCHRFGFLWSLRMIERFNATALSHSWNARLGWAFPEQASGEAMGEVEWSIENWPPAARDNLRNLLRRFASATWFDEGTLSAR